MRYPHLSTFASTMALTMAALSAGQALAADPVMPKSRAEVRQEMEDAKSTGEIQANDLDGWPVDQHPPMAKGPGLTREQVRQEREDAERNGEIQANDLDGWPLDQHPPNSTGPSFSREQVRKEMEESQRNPPTSVWPKSYDN